VIARSSAEVEYKVMTLSLCKMMWVKILLSELRLFRGEPLQLWCDSKSAINIVNNLVQHDRNKHVEINQFFIKEQLNLGALNLNYVKFEE
jgi:hypothetical protein